MNEDSDKKGAKKADTAAWVEEHEDSLDYPDVPVGDRDYEFDESMLSPEVQKALAERKAQFERESKNRG